MKSLKSAICLGVLACWPASLPAQPSPQAVCQKMIDDGRNGPLTLTDCHCTYRVADAVLDDDIKALLFDSWYNGNSNMARLEKLPRPGRVKRQFRSLERALKKNCDLSP